MERLPPMLPLCYRHLLAQYSDQVRSVPGLLEQSVCVFAQSGRCPRREHRAVLKANRRGNSANLAVLGMLEIKHQLLLGNKRVLECLLHVVDRSDRHFSPQPRDPFCCRRSRENGVQLLRDLLPIFQTRCERRILRIRGPLGLAQSFGQCSPEFLLVAHDEQPAVLGAAKLAWRERGMARTRLTIGNNAAIQVPGSDVGEVMKSNVEKANVEIAPPSGRLFDVALHNLAYVATWYLNGGIVTNREPRSSHPSLTPSQLCRTKDGWLFIMCN